MKVILDTNVLISAVFWKGAPHQILKAAEDNLLVIAASAEILQEFYQVIRRPKFRPYLKQAGHTAASIAEKMSFWFSYFRLRTTFRLLPRIQPIISFFPAPYLLALLLLFPATNTY
ncbi:MAG: putative toxin-antitoxin system toxin component, PIN family [Deltaproteobacteria bacterium]|nr:putative toxin-antitoxin system toxin component, PIN family [Deltaproteobacteria bacterium]